MEMQAPGADPATGRLRKSVLIALWILFALLVAIGAWLFLRACGTYPGLGLGRNFCPVPIDHSALQREVDVADALRRSIHQAELQVAELPICVPPPRSDDEIRRSRQIDQSVIRRGGKTGRLQFTLIWHTKDDLDLNLTCPGGVISSKQIQRGPGICGDGVKDIDANRTGTNNVTTYPIENIVFANDIPSGLYTIEVVEYAALDETLANSIPFTLRIRYGDDERICNGTVEWRDPYARERTANGVIAGTERTLRWTAGDPLPECNFISSPTYLGAHK